MNSSGCWGALDLWLRALCSRTPGVRTIHYVHSLRTVTYALAALQTDIRMQTHLFSLYTYGICCIAFIVPKLLAREEGQIQGPQARSDNIECRQPLASLEQQCQSPSACHCVGQILARPPCCRQCK